MGRELPWTCVKQVAGALVKEIRYWRAPNRKGDLPSVRKAKNDISAQIRNSCFARTPQDRLELRLALMGYQSTFYTLTFSSLHLPDTYRQVQRKWKSFLRAMKRHRNRDFDYIYAIEGKHGDHRFHIHLIVRNNDFTKREIEYLWGWGMADAQPLMQGKDATFRDRAEYLVKEKRDGVVVPTGARYWSCSRSLNAKLPPPVKSKAATGDIIIPPGARSVRPYRTDNAFGAYRYVTYIKP